MISRGPDKPITEYKQAINFIKELSKATQKHFPYTSDRLSQIVRVLRKHQP